MYHPCQNKTYFNHFTAMSFSKKRKELRAMLDYAPGAAKTDLASQVDRGQLLSTDDQNRSVHTFKSIQLTTWMEPKRSTYLVVHGNVTDPRTQTAFSFVCANVVSMLQNIPKPLDPTVSRPKLIPLYFFCGQNPRKSQGWETPSGLVNSLIAQLLDKCRKLDPTDTLELGDFKKKNNRMKYVFERFECLVWELPADTTVFCVIDGLSFYLDDQDTTKEAELLVERLMWLMRRHKRRKSKCTFKLLLTAQNRLHSAEVRGMNMDHVLELAARPQHTGDYNPTKWNGFVEQLQRTIAPEVFCKP